MVVITEEQNINSNINIGVQSFFDDLDSTETLLNDWKLIQESEEMGGEVDAKVAYFEGLKFINNLHK